MSDSSKLQASGLDQSLRCAAAMLADREEDHDFYVSPKHGEFSAATGGASRHLMVNGTSDRIAIKIKCSNNEAYRVSPVYTCLRPGNAKRLQIIRDPGEPKLKTDKLVLLYKKTRCRNARDAFQMDSGIGEDEVQQQPSEVKKKLIALIVKDPVPAAQEGEDGLASPEENIGSSVNPVILSISHN